MAQIDIDATEVGNSLDVLLMAPDIQPGDDPSYQLCKTIYLYHPLGAKMAEIPIAMAQSQEREIEIPGAPEGIVADAFKSKWKEMLCDEYIFNGATMARVYGVTALAAVAPGLAPDKPLPFDKLYEIEDLSFNVIDPLNASGSFSRLSDPNSTDFMKYFSLQVQQVSYHFSRAIILQNEKPVYLAYSNASFGYVGRSVYQRALYPLKSFIESMRADDMVARKVGLLIAKMKMPGSMANGMMARVMGAKRGELKVGKTNQILTIGEHDSIESLNLMNIDGAHENARKHILENLASSNGMPAVLLNNETYAEGFGEGSEDAKSVARFIDRERIKLNPVYKWFDDIVMRMAWTPEFYKTIQDQFEEYKSIDFNTAFYKWKNAFKATWPSLLTEPDSEKAKKEDIKLKAIIAILEVLIPVIDPVNCTRLMQWVMDNLNEIKFLFPEPLTLDIDALKTFLEEKQKALEDAAEAATQAPGEPGEGQEGDKPAAEPKPEGANT